jgi:hypothetical protein
MSIYNDLQKVATGLLKEFKQGSIELVQFVHSENSTPDNPGKLEEVVTPLDAVANGERFKFMNTSFINSSDIEVITAVVEGIIPSVNDFINIDGVKYKVIQFNPLPAAGTACAWKFIVRKGG